MNEFEVDAEIRQKLRERFAPEQIGKLPATKNRPELDFVGHAVVTDRLNQVVPGWSYVVDDEKEVKQKLVNQKTGEVREDVTYWIRGTITIGGISRVEYGDGSSWKEAIGNFIRRGAMRFGVALDLWSREELEDVAASGAEAVGLSAGKTDAVTSAPVDVVTPVESEPASAEPEADAGSVSGSVRRPVCKVNGLAHVADPSKTALPGWEVCACGVARKIGETSSDWRDVA